jgi:peptide/nickel transport system permease protein
MSLAPEPVGTTGAAVTAMTSPRWRRPRFTVFGWMGIAILSLWLVVAILGPFVTPYGENALPFPDAYGAYQKPQPGAWLGTDTMDRDVLTRLVYGASRTLGISLMATAIAYFAGVVLGVGAAVLGGVVDLVVSRINDALLSLPTIMLGLIVVAALGTSIPVLIGVAGFVYVPIVYRIARALGMEVNTQEFVEVAKLRGEGLWWIITREVWPNIWLPLLSDFGLRLIYVILFVSSLSFLGLGIQPPQADWGSMVRENLGALQFGDSPMAVLAPAAAIASVTVAISFIVDDLSTAASRRMSGRT